MPTTLAFNFKAYYRDEKHEETNSTLKGLSSIEDFCSSEKFKASPLKSASLPLATSCEWYKKQGELSKANAARSEARRSCQSGETLVNNEKFSFVLGSQTTESLSDSIKRLEEMVLVADEKRKARLTGVMDVARCLRDSFPLMKTQKAGQMYKRHIYRELNEIQPDNDPKTVRTTSSEIYTILAKHLNIMHLYINGTGFIMESKDGGPFREFFEQIVDLLRTENFKTTLNSHIEKEIGKTYKTVLSYMDTERDKHAMK